MNQMATKEKVYDGLSIAGFIVALVGFFCPYGVIGTVGLILSVVSLKKEKNGLNIAGTILGALSVLKIILWAGVFLFSMALY